MVKNLNGLPKKWQKWKNKFFSGTPKIIEKHILRLFRGSEDNKNCILTLHTSPTKISEQLLQLYSLDFLPLNQKWCSEFFLGHPLGFLDSEHPLSLWNRNCTTIWGLSHHTEKHRNLFSKGRAPGAPPPGHVGLKKTSRLILTKYLGNWIKINHTKQENNYWTYWRVFKL